MNARGIVIRGRCTDKEEIRNGESIRTHVSQGDVYMSYKEEAINNPLL